MPLQRGSRPVLVIDSGGGHIKAGLASCSKPVIEPNCSAVPKGRRTAGKHLAFGCDVADLPAYRLYRPSRRGLVMDTEQQKAIWEAMLLRHSSQVLAGMKPRDCTVLLLLPQFLPKRVQQEIEEIFREDFNFAEVLHCEGPVLALRSPGIQQQLERGGRRSPCCTVLDLGFSACFAQPCVEGKAVADAGRRMSIGGRVLTNILLENLKLRHFDLSNSWLVAEDILAKTGEVVRHFNKALLADYAGVDTSTYILPDFVTHKKGFLVTSDRQENSGEPGVQSVSLRSERVAVPEALFQPQDHGLPTAGIAQLVRDAILAVNDEACRLHLGSVVLCGGLARLPGLAPRLRAELRHLLPSHWPVEVFVEEEPQLSLWRGAAQLAAEGGDLAACLAEVAAKEPSPSKRKAVAIDA